MTAKHFPGSAIAGSFGLLIFARQALSDEFMRAIGAIVLAPADIAALAEAFATGRVTEPLLGDF